MKTNNITNPPREPGPFTILVKATGKKVEGLTIEAVHEQEKAESSIVFITAAKKRWKIRFHEFSFVFPATQPQPA